MMLSGVFDLCEVSLFTPMLFCFDFDKFNLSLDWSNDSRLILRLIEGVPVLL